MVVCIMSCNCKLVLMNEGWQGRTLGPITVQYTHSPRNWTLEIWHTWAQYRLPSVNAPYVQYWSECTYSPPQHCYWISIPCGVGQMPSIVNVRMCLKFSSQSDGDQRTATVRTVSHEVILSAPQRIRFLYANVWWSSGLLCDRSTMFYFNSWKDDISVREVTFKVNTKRPSS